MNQLLADEFPQDSSTVYLNHAAVAPWPLRTGKAVQDFAEENVRFGAANYPQWLQKEHLLRRQFRELIHARTVEEIALVKNTSEALSFVAHGLSWTTGDNVITTDMEFPSNRIVWESLSRYGVEARIAPLKGAADPEQALLDQIDSKTRLLAVSSVQYGNGMRMNLQRLGSACREKGVLFCVDAIQSIGAVQFDVQEICADFAMADGHKWMLGPEGLGVFYVRAEVMEQLSLNEFGWHMIEDQGNYDRTDWEIASSARRFECGSGNMIGAHALSASLSLLLEVGMSSVEKQLLANLDYLTDLLGSVRDLNILSPLQPERRAGIITFGLAGKDPEPVFRGLKERGVICALRGGGIRFSPHFYLSEAQLAKATEHLKESII